MTNSALLAYDDKFRKDVSLYIIGPSLRETGLYSSTRSTTFPKHGTLFLPDTAYSREPRRWPKYDMSKRGCHIQPTRSHHEHDQQLV